MSGFSVAFYAEIAQRAYELKVILALQRAIVGYVKVYLDMRMVTQSFVRGLFLDLCF